MANLIGLNESKKPEDVTVVDGRILVSSSGSITESPIGTNSTITPLASGATFAGTGEQNNQPDVMVSCTTDNSGTLFFDFSPDNVNYGTFPTAGFAVAAGIHEFHIAVKGPRYFRVRLVNDTGAQSYLRLYTYYGMFDKPNAPLNQALSDDSDAVTVKAVLSGSRPDGSYVTVPVNKAGALAVEDFQTEAALGNHVDYQISAKFGRVKAMDGADTPFEIWAFADDAASPRSGTKTFPTTASTIYVTSSSASDTAVTVTADYIDATGAAVTTGNITLTGQTPVSIGATGLDVNRMRVTSSTAAVGIIYASVGNDFTSGAPNDVTDILAVIPAGYGQSQLSHFTVPLGETLVMDDLILTVSRASGSAGSAEIDLKIKIFGSSWRTVREFFPTTAAPLTEGIKNIVLPARTQVRWEVTDVSDSDTNISVTWGYQLIAD